MAMKFYVFLQIDKELRNEKEAGDSNARENFFPKILTK
jgi:hypothetical protein